MAMTIVRVTSGGIPVTESATGFPYYEADNGFGIPVTFGSTGIPLGTASNPAAFAPFPAPAGFFWDFVIDDANNSRVIDDVSGQPEVTLVGT